MKIRLTMTSRSKPLKRVRVRRKVPATPAFKAPPSETFAGFAANALPEHYLRPGVEKIEGELLRFHVQSRGRRSVKHVVDLRPFAFNGRCSCEHFTFKMLSHLEGGALPSDKLRCWHIRQALKWYAEWSLPRVWVVLNGGKP